MSNLFVIFQISNRFSIIKDTFSIGAFKKTTEKIKGRSLVYTRYLEPIFYQTYPLLQNSYLSRFTLIVISRKINKIK